MAKTEDSANTTPQNLETPTLGKQGKSGDANDQHEVNPEELKKYKKELKMMQQNYEDTLKKLKDRYNILGTSLANA